MSMLGVPKWAVKQARYCLRYESVHAALRMNFVATVYVSALVVAILILSKNKIDY